MAHKPWATSSIGPTREARPNLWPWRRSNEHRRSRIGLGGEISDEPNAPREEAERLRYPRWEAEYRLKVLQAIDYNELALLFATPPAHKGLGLPAARRSPSSLAPTARAGWSAVETGASRRSASASSATCEEPDEA